MESPTRLLQFDAEDNAMLLERCYPGTPLGDLLEPEQVVILAGLSRRPWREPPESHPFRTLSVLTQRWNARAREKADGRVDTGLVEEGMRLFEELPRTATQYVLLATDLDARPVRPSFLNSMGRDSC